MAVYNEQIVVSVQDQATAPLNNIQQSVNRTESSLRRLTARPWQVIVSLADKTRAALAGVMRGLQGLIRPLTIPLQLGKFSATGLIGGLGGLGFAAMGLREVAMAGQAAVNVMGFGLATEMENTGARMMAFTKDAGKTAEILEIIKDRAAATPFSFGEMSTAAASLLPMTKSANIGLEELMKTAEILAASNPMQGLEGASFSLREALSGDFVSIQDRFNLSRSTINKWKAEGVSNIEIVRKAMQDMGMDESLVANMAKTLGGRWSTFMDTVAEVQRILIAPIFSRVSESLVTLQQILADNLDTLKEWGKTFGDTVGSVMDTLGRFGNMIRAVFLAFTKDSGAMGIVMTEIRKVFGDTIADGVEPFIKAFRDAIPSIINFAREVRLRVTLAADALRTLWFAHLQRVWRWLSEVAWPIAQRVFGRIADFVRTKLLPAFQRIWPVIVAAFAGISGFVTDTIIPALGKLAEWLGPKLEAAFTWIVDEGWPMLQKTLEAIGSFIVVEVVPKLAAIGEWLNGPEVKAAYAWITDIGWPNFQKAIEAVIGYIVGTAIPRLGDLKDAVAASLAPTPEGAAAGPDPFAQLKKIFDDFGTSLDAWRRTGQAIADIWTMIFPTREQVDNTSMVAGVMYGLLTPLEKVGEGFKLYSLLVAGAWETNRAFVAWWISDFFPAIKDLVARWDEMITNWKNTGPAEMAELGKLLLEGMLNGMLEFFKGIQEWVNKNIGDPLVAAIKNAFKIASPSQVMAELGVNIMEGLIAGLQSKLGDLQAMVGNITGAIGGAFSNLGSSLNPSVGGDVTGWLNEAIAATGVDPSWLPGLQTIAQHESGGNPSAINNWDVNAQGGDPSRGLMQTIGSTFNANALPGHGDIMNPVDNAIAAIRYIQGRYGSIDKVPGVASMAAGGAYKPYDNGGILPPGLTMAVNRTGRNEYVSTGRPGGINISLGGINVDARGAMPGVAGELEAQLPSLANRLMMIVAPQLESALLNMEGA